MNKKIKNNNDLFDFDENENEKYREHLKLESSQKIIIPDNISVERREELNLLNEDPYSHFLKYVLPFMTEEEKAKREKGDLFDSGAFDDDDDDDDDDENELVNSFDLDVLDRLIDFEEEE